MAWSLATIVPKLDELFAQQNRKYRVQHPNALSPRIYIQYEGKELDTDTIESITGMFPDDVYVNFIHNVRFEDSGTEVEVVRKPTIREIGRSPEKLKDLSSAFGDNPLRKKERKAVRTT